MALAAGADLLCLGGEDAGEQMLDDVRDAIVDAVRERPAQHRPAARRRAPGSARLAGLADRPRRAGPLRPDGPARVAAAALQIAGPLPPTRRPRCWWCAARRSTNLAVGTIPWGLAQRRPSDPPTVAGLPECRCERRSAPDDDIRLGRRNGSACSPGTGIGIRG